MEKVTVRIGKLRVRVSKETHERFVDTVKQTVGPTKEDYHKSVLEAINNWCAAVEYSKISGIKAKNPFK